MRHSSFVLAAVCGLLLAGGAQGQAASDVPPPAQRAVNEYERMGHFIYAFHRAGVSTEQLTDPVLARRGPPELAQRAAALADKFDQLVKQRAAVPDEELAATLREARAVGAAIALWRQGGSLDEPSRP